MSADTPENKPHGNALKKNKEKLQKILQQQAEPCEQELSFQEQNDDNSDQPAKVVPESEVVDQIHQYKMKISSLTEELEQEKDNVLREKAELLNRLKRKDQEKDNALRFAQEKFFKDFLLVLDSVDGALLQDSQQVTTVQLLEGLKMMATQMQSTLSSFGLEIINPDIGSVFSPQTSEAMSMQPTDEYPANSVMVVVQKGYLYNGRLLRPARVIVSNTPQEQSE